MEGDNVNDIVNFEKTHFFLFPATYFFPVTSYMNEKVCKLCTLCIYVCMYVCMYACVGIGGWGIYVCTVHTYACM